jgi:antirestriction protein ArdC
MIDFAERRADDFLHSTGVDIREGHGEACYIPSRDFISMPAFAGFKGVDHFYNVAFHELTALVRPSVARLKPLYRSEEHSDEFNE